MLFYISNKQDYNNNLNLECKKFDDFWFYHDTGWIINDKKVKKGTSNNWCEINFANGVQIKHNEIRDFPLWYNENCCSNIETLENYLPTDAHLKFDGKWHVTYDTPTLGDMKISESEAIELLEGVLIDNTNSFVKSNTLPLAVPDNTGLDTLLARSVFDHLGVDYDLFTINQAKYPNRQVKMYESYWGFNQIQNFDKPTCIISGFYGDEFMLRNPAYVQSFINGDVVDAFDRIESSYMKHFFNLVYKEKCKTLPKLTKDKVKEMIINDIQVWHLDEVFVFNPYRDVRLLQLLNCDEELIIKQVTDGYLSKTLLKKFNPTLCDLLDKEKNTNEPAWFEDAEYLKK